ncbi:undecaprenyldiphospho-muramoylpentapeptide beta-N-acetylglucosaminyltransferase [Paenalkalicoccus suaedae]|uniref:UDP-N-acetylglucosamine--N-acetylmuramyl-(pentapeptide) pyrophosphoryl-undecaprenol N-acetylglucosamine transferase n=1 Tax=Paenalkalicoccus suaedae TaxID=2592382 RepID=A0A859FFR7_9BACI|nr:undecaprenyldiphospho-muramoylpentapeptide beta-N-acetylglucosaminyltransferase [Paenalkalicoccus suaedae]QKS71522.1 undecaprenyldiphospho-muramoylpentapeptide beta-N-acetylglucosaminyltransferase [Paenalkalicoccus suaedae]
MKVLVSGGGTGGHIYPALALIRHIASVNPEAEFLYIGTENGLEGSIAPKSNIPFKTVTISGFKRKISLHNVRTVYQFLKAVTDSKKYMKEFRPDVVIGTGGYVCGPVVYAASKLGIPTIIHEQNSVPGLTNKFLSKYVTKVAISFEEAASYFPKEKTIFTGNPRASEVAAKAKSESKEAIKQLGLDPTKKTLLVVGGSRGARPLNEAMLASLEEFGSKSYQCIYVTGDVHYDSVKQKMGEATPNILAVPYIHDMPALLLEIDAVVARAGATTLAELTALGIPSILIPSPYVTNNHQEKNARALEKVGAAKVILEKDVTPSVLLKACDDLLENNEAWSLMSRSAYEAGMPEASAKLVGVMESIIKVSK